MDAGTDIDLLIATDCISEGQNLQDCDAVLNYDIHWNPVRIIQRFGRVDRIGSRSRSVRMVNLLAHRRHGSVPETAEPGNKRGWPWQIWPPAATKTPSPKTTPNWKLEIPRYATA